MADKKEHNKDEHKKDEKKKHDEKHDHRDEKIVELTNTLQRLQAEFENYKKRIDKEKEEFKKYSKAELVIKFLPILDSFEMAVKSCKVNDEVLKGFELIYSQFYSVLKCEGVRPIECVGKKFDPYVHEVLMKQDSDKEEDIILEELQKGYMLGDRVIRTSRVKISKGKKDDNQKDTSKECA